MKNKRPEDEPQDDAGKLRKSLADVERRVYRIEIVGGVIVALGIVAQLIAFVTTPSIKKASEKAAADLRAEQESVLATIRRSHDYLVFVNPVAWHNSGIEVKKGSEISFRAEGRITIAYAELVQSVETRLRIEARRRSAGLDPDDFSAAELDSITPRWDWAGPDGYEKFRSRSKPGRERTLPIPDVNIGALIGLVGSSSGPPEKPQGVPFLIGSRQRIRVDRDGVLWFAVNDVGFYPDRPADYPRIYYRDNSGMFVVRVTVEQ